jgi:hypothetical protein
MKRYGPVGRQWNSRKYLRMHNESISRGLKSYWANRKQYNEENFEAFAVVALILFISLMILIMIKG